MENRSHALIAGLFTLLLGLSAVAALWWFGGKQEANNEYLVTSMRNVTGLTVQGQVRYRGIRVGKVESISLDPTNVRTTLIRISVNKDIPISRGTTAKLGFQGVTGIAHVLLEDSGKDPAPLLADAGVLPRIAMQDSLLDELTDVGSDTLRKARELMANANEMLSAENRQNFARILANLEATTASTRESAAPLRQVLTPENTRLLHSTLTSANQAAGNASAFFSDARATALRVQTLSEKLETAVGTSPAGGSSALLPRLGQLSEELSTTTHHLDRVLQMLEDSPQSLIFGHQQAAPGPGEPGFVEPAAKQGQP